MQKCVNLVALWIISSAEGTVEEHVPVAPSQGEPSRAARNGAPSLGVLLAGAGDLYTESGQYSLARLRFRAAEDLRSEVNNFEK